jgi:branched-chain amino acid transport system permease protein
MTSAPARLLIYLALFAAAAVGPFIVPAYQSQLTELWLFIVFALTWDLVGGQMGYNSFGNVLFFGVGMYACTLTQVGLFYNVGVYNAARGGGQTVFTFDLGQYAEGLALGLPLGAVLAAVTAVIVGSFVLRMRGQYFAVCTLGLGFAAAQIANAWTWIGAGSGMVAPNPPDAVNLGRMCYYLALVLMAVVFIILHWLYRTRFGLAINAIRDDEDKAEAMGHFTTRIKITAWTIAAFFLGISGGIYGNLKRFIDAPNVAFPSATIGVWMILMAVLGGKGTLMGPLVGAIVFQVFKELFWTYMLGWQRVALGLLIVVIVVFFPQGIMGWVTRRKAPAIERQAADGAS